MPSHVALTPLWLGWKLWLWAFLWQIICAQSTWQNTLHSVLITKHQSGGWGLENLLATILASSTDLKEFKLQTGYSCWPSGKLCGNHSQMLFQTIIKGYYCKINGRALGEALWHSLGGPDRQAQTRGVSESVAVAAGRDLLAWGKKCFC